MFNKVLKAIMKNFKKKDKGEIINCSLTELDENELKELRLLQEPICGKHHG